MRLLDRFLWLCDVVHARVKRDAGICDPGTLISIGISLAISAISYGIQALLAPKPPPVVGPRLDDLGNPTTNPGRNIPYAKGRNITSGQLIWSTGLVETENREKVKGGKGGGKSTTVITYTYSTSIALAFNDGEICGVQRILANGAKVIWSARIGEELSEGAIDAQVQAKYDEVFAEQTTYWSAQTNPDGSPRFTASEVEDLADANATNESEALRKELEAQNADLQPRYSAIEFFFGTEDQLPSAIIEGVEGAGNVSAFRGTAYVVIQDLQLADFGNFLPSFTIDYATEGTVAGSSITETEGPDDSVDTIRHDTVIWDFARSKAFAQPGGTGFLNPSASIYEYSLTTLGYVQTHDISGLNSGGGMLLGLDPVTGYLVGSNGGPPFQSYVYDPATKTAITNTSHSSGQEVIDPSPDEVGYMVITNSAGTNASVLTTDHTDESHAHTFPALAYQKTFLNPEPSKLFPIGVGPKQHWNAGSFGQGARGEAWLPWVSPERIDFYQYTIDAAGVVTETNAGGIDSTQIHPTLVFNPFQLDSIPYYVTTDGSLVMFIHMGSVSGSGPSQTIITSQDYLIRWHPTNGLQWATEVSLFEANVPARQAVQLSSSRFVVADQIGAFFDIDLTNGTITSNDLGGDGPSLNTSSTVWDGGNNCLYAWDDTNPVSGLQVLKSYCFGGVCIDDPISLTDVISGFMTRAGFDASEFTIDSAIDAETIWGMSDNSGRSSRDNLEDLARIRPVIVNEIEGKIRFRLADQSTVATIPKEDVRAYDGSASPPEWITEVQTLEDLALPKTLRITYQDRDRALNPTTAIFTREITQSRTVNEFAVQAVDTAEAMRNSVFTAMSVLVAGKRTFKLSVPLKYMVLEPGDVINIPVSETRTAKARVLQATLGANNIVELECTLYIDTSLGIVHTDQFAEVSTDTAQGVLATEVLLLDIPYLTDSAELNDLDEEDSGIYAAVAYRSTGFPGANVYVDTVKLQTTDDGFGNVTQGTGAPQWTLAGTFTRPTHVGRIVQLPDPAASALVQDSNSELIVAFRTPGGAWTTIGDVEILTSQDNAFLVGNEIIQAQTAELLGTTAEGFPTYSFTNLYRGQQGTEWAIGTQAVGDDVVLLDSGAIQRIDLENDELPGFSVDFRAATVGSDLTAATTVSLAYTAASRKPYAPGIENVQRDGSGNLTFDLLQRNRYGADWNPSDPAFESDPKNFEVDVMNGATVVRTLTISDAVSFAYTAAQQVTDFGSTQASVTVRPYQLNSLGNRGFTNEDTI